MLILRGDIKDILLADINGIERRVNYIPLKEVPADVSKLSTFISVDDLLLVLTVNNSKYGNDMTNVTGKMAVLDCVSEINLIDFTRCLAYMKISELNIISINLSPKVEHEIFLIHDSPKITYIEIGVLSFIELIGNNTKDFFLNWNKSALYILRDGTYKDMKYLLSQAGEHGMNLGREGSQRSHVVSPWELRLNSYLMAMSYLEYPYLAEQNLFNGLPKDKYLPFYQVNKPKKAFRRVFSKKRRT